MEIILSVLLFISMVFNFVLLKYQPTVYLVSEPTLVENISVVNPILERLDESIPEVKLEVESESPDIRSNREYNPWKNEKNIQQTMPNSSSTHKQAPPLKPLERPYGFSR